MPRTARRRNAATRRDAPMTKEAIALEQGTFNTTDLKPEADKESEKTDAREQIKPGEWVASKSLLQQLRDWVATVPADTPYHELIPLAREAGWDWHIRQGSTPHMSEKAIILSFDVLIGRQGDDIGTFQWADVVSFALPAVPGPVSVAARMQLAPSLIYLLFGRLPPQQTNQQPAPETHEMHDSDIDLSNGAGNAADDDIEPPVTGADIPDWVPGASAGGLPDIVAAEDGGIPIFKDLDDVEAPSQDIIVAVTNVVNSALVKMTTTDQVLAMWNRNQPAFDWLTDMATPEQRAAITGAFSRRKGQIEGGFAEVTPRRRGAVN